MNVLLIDALSVFAADLRARGHTVKELHLGGGIFHFSALVADGFVPDLVVQQEHLGRRSYIGGLEHASCPTLFWALDTHLNMFWQQWYALLFDVVLTPHVSLFEPLPPCRRPADVQRFAIPGTRWAWTPHAERRRHLGLCARVDQHRAIRRWLVELLQPEGLVATDGLSPTDMLGFYAGSRVVPNECIASEVNFRLLEAASTGCLVLSPDVGPDQDALLIPGKEFFPYHDGVELLGRVAWSKARPVEAERMGRAAMVRVQTEHLPEHRIAALLGLYPAITAGRATGDAAALAFWIVLAKQIRNRLLPLDGMAHAETGLHLVRRRLTDTDVSPLLHSLLINAAAQILLLFAEGPGSAPAPERAFLLCRDMLGWDPALLTPEKEAVSGSGVDCLEVAAAASAFALSQRDFGLARTFWLRYAGQGGQALPATPGELCIAWAAAFRRRGCIFDSGFLCEPDKGGLPESALNWLIFGRHLEANAVRAEEFTALLRDRPALRSFSVGYYAEQCLADPENWRVQQEFGLECLRACRVCEGLSEIAEAYRKAEAAGRKRLFLSRLKASASDGRDWTALLGS